MLTEEGYVVEAVPTRPHGAEPKRFERARPGELWQTDLLTFRLPRQNHQVHVVVVFLDDHSRFVVGYGPARDGVGRAYGADGSGGCLAVWARWFSFSHERSEVGPGSRTWVGRRTRRSRRPA